MSAISLAVAFHARQIKRCEPILNSDQFKIGPYLCISFMLALTVKEHIMKKYAWNPSPIVL